jgi:hypothetical protein
LEIEEMIAEINVAEDHQIAFEEYDEPDLLNRWEDRNDPQL